MKRLKWLALGWLGLSSIQAVATEVQQVSVLNAEFEPIKKLTSPAELAQFQPLWQARIEQPRPSPVGHSLVWPYKLDLVSQGKSARWLYHPDGWLQRLSMKYSRLYRLANPQAFNLLLGIK